MGPASALVASPIATLIDAPVVCVNGFLLSLLWMHEGFRGSALALSARERKHPLVQDYAAEELLAIGWLTTIEHLFFKFYLRIFSF